jgi:hypothetical protein
LRSGKLGDALASSLFPLFTIVAARSSLDASEFIVGVQTAVLRCRQFATLRWAH